MKSGDLCLTTWGVLVELTIPYVTVDDVLAWGFENIEPFDYPVTSLFPEEVVRNYGHLDIEEAKEQFPEDFI